MFCFSVSVDGKIIFVFIGNRIKHNNKSRFCLIVSSFSFCRINNKEITNSNKNIILLLANEVYEDLVSLLLYNEMIDYEHFLKKP